MPLTSQIAPYDPEWPGRFESEAARLRSIFGFGRFEIHYVGSTAVPGLAAKPEIDILAVYHGAEISASTEQQLKDLGYRRGGDLTPGHHFFKRDIDGVRTHKLHVIQASHPKIAHLLAFRDKLRANDVLRSQYEHLKLRLERENISGIREYLDGKEPFIDAVVLGRPFEDSAKGLASRLICVAVETADQPDIDRLLAVSDAVAARLYPGEFRRPLTGRALADTEASMFVARDASGQALGCAALIDLPDGTAELKRMIIDPQYAGQGVGRKLLLGLLQTAKERGIRSVLLEVGIRNVEARRLYESVGFRDRGPFGRYEQTPIATFMQIDL
jgi:putative acetyltransferase